MYHGFDSINACRKIEPLRVLNCKFFLSFLTSYELVLLKPITCLFEILWPCHLLSFVPSSLILNHGYGLDDVRFILVRLLILKCNQEEQLVLLLIGRRLIKLGREI
jgi:hypothetical protein